MKTILLEAGEIRPSKIVCIGRNYAEHIAELGNEVPSQQVIFVKPNSALSHDIFLHGDEPIHFEAEICFTLKDGQLHGLGFGLDLTKRELQSRLKQKGLPWERSKAFDGAAVLSNFVLCPSDIENVRLELYINGALVQSGGYQLMLHKPQEIVEEVQSFMSFDDDDILMTGTPKGVGKICLGDTFIGKIWDNNQLLIEQQWQVTG